jgi:transposase-like protein
MANWKKIKAEYLRGGISQAALAEKHGVAYSTLRDRAQKEGWTALRAKTRQKTGEKMPDAISDENIEDLRVIVKRLISQEKKAIRQNTMRQVVTRTRTLKNGVETHTVHVSYEDTKVIDKPGLRLLTQTAKDLDELVRRQTAGAGKNAGVQVVFDGEAEELSV